MVAVKKSMVQKLVKELVHINQVDTKSKRSQLVDDLVIAHWNGLEDLKKGDTTNQIENCVVIPRSTRNKASTSSN